MAAFINHLQILIKQQNTFLHCTSHSYLVKTIERYCEEFVRLLKFFDDLVPFWRIV